MKKKWQFRLGLILVIVSIPMFFALFVLPFLKISVSLKLTITPILFAVAEVVFWVGSLLVGKEVIARYWKNINPLNWFKKGKMKQTDKKDME